ncbi:hypothetical protein EOPP23_08785 [Endozoicomonas sp. OPT23]|uniref:HAD family acid phosphatase n=1 Tax=Endozoicomonas sp. OPT23 TaxID=2072845 RepID=UPI00129A4732|nr:HAD family acid phosphatase [Endozoicomonas sp. OPT23]MRI33077.1 hypothetical protein [Endozoicomonas sp. OPT23]
MLQNTGTLQPPSTSKPISEANFKIKLNSQEAQNHLKKLSHLGLASTPLIQRQALTSHSSRAALYNTIGSALVWKQLSAAGRVALYQTYAQLWQALEERTDTLEEGEQLALFVDLDDGSVESTPYFTSLMGTENKMAPARSEEWWRTQLGQIKSPYLPEGRQGEHNWSYPLPGAKEFLTKALATNKVKICYLTSRSDESIKPATINMLKRFGFPGVCEESVRIATSQTSKPSHISDFEKDCAGNFYIGDKLGDLNIATKSLSFTAMKSLVSSPAVNSRLGTEAFIVPNPVYGPGCWEDITHAPFTKTADESRQNRREQLKVWEDSGSSHASGRFNPITEQLEQSLLYMQSPAYDALTQQTYCRAAAEARKLLAQQDPKKVVAVMDIDGTVVNNSPWIAGLSKKGQTSSQESLHRFVTSGTAEKVSGVDQLLGVYREKSIPVVWVTNRAASSIAGQEEVRLAAQKQLEKKGLFKEGDVILIKNDPSLTQAGLAASSKRDRFAAIEQGRVIDGRDQILQFVGDDPADLDLPAEPFHSQSTSNWPAESSEIGSKRVLIPNPIFYRGWNTALAKHWYPDTEPTDCGLWARNIIELTSWQPEAELKEKTSKLT